MSNLVKNKFLETERLLLRPPERRDPATLKAGLEKIGEQGPIRLQDHGCKVRYRNIWLQPLTK